MRGLRVLAVQELLGPLLARALFLIGLNAKIGLNAQEFFFIGIDILRGVKMWESEGFVNVRSISRFCECDLL